MSQQLRKWMADTPTQKREAVAAKAQTSVAYLWQLSGNHRKASLELAKRLQDASNRELTIEGLRPDVFGDKSVA